MKPSSILTAYQSVRLLAISALSHIDNLNSYGSIGWFALRRGQLKPYALTQLWLKKFHLISTSRPFQPGTSTSRHAAQSMSSTSNNVGLRGESLSFNTSYPPRTRPPPSASIVSTPTASFGPWALRRTIWPLAPPLMKLFLLADNHTVSMTPIHHQNHLRPRPLRPHLHPIRHLHLLVHAHALHLHPILNAYFMIPLHLPLPHEQLLPAVLLPLPSLRHWTVLLMVADFYMVTSGRQLDTGHLLHRLRLLLTRYFHHSLLDLPFRLWSPPQDFCT